MDYNYFDSFSRLYVDTFKFLPEYGLLIKNKPKKPWELFNQIAYKLEKYIEEPKEIICKKREKLKFQINYLVKQNEDRKLSNEEEEEEDEDESVSSSDKPKEDKELDENTYLSLEIRYNFDKSENMEFVNFTKVYGSTFDFYQKIKEIKKILV